ncbi:hypothetical protein [Methylocystis sp. ATCC 49242]|uniref:hypothetical protein n=1 Tax=Methylocystis sp. ATCC 49242 TaxID=622637 RepID=UPI0001F8848A|nr:hypothetical protein [Methylocystis sp. ATCC 49242]
MKRLAYAIAVMTSVSFAAEANAAINYGKWEIVQYNIVSQVKMSTSYMCLKPDGTAFTIGSPRLEGNYVVSGDNVLIGLKKTSMNVAFTYSLQSTSKSEMGGFYIAVGTAVNPAFQTTYRIVDANFVGAVCQ